MKVALIQARGNDRRDYGSPPGFRCMKQMTESEIPGAEVEIFSDYRLLIQYQPDIVGIGAVTPVFDSAKYLADIFKKELNAHILLGGYHITFLPTEIKSAPFDIGILGEGEQIFLDLLRLYHEHGAFTAYLLRKIPGLVFCPEAE
ncbi:MAG: anaerobic magnesium-protoporphyrin monomethyl ester cyclase, partial [Acidobacteriota bacterium]|nr:anaerobic magnesium-protoporphyrin monomethyl ester cyclase [Acidobacteriota bacterium]